MLHAYFVPLVKGQCWGSCALQTGASTIEHTYICSVYLQYLNIWSYFFQLRSQTTKPRHGERMRKLNKSAINVSKNPMSGSYPVLVLSFLAVQNRYVFVLPTTY